MDNAVTSMVSFMKRR